MKVAGKVIVVTGAASGIGAGLARRFSAEGPAAIVVADLDGEGAAAVAAELGGYPFQVDVADAGSHQALIDAVEKRHGPIDLFCANAGIAFPGDEQSPSQDWERAWRVNFLSHVHAARQLVPRWRARGEGYLLVTASAAGLLTNLGAAQYTVTKHAAVAFAEWLAITHGRAGIKVSCLCPQGVQTPMLARAGKVADWLTEGALTPAQVAETVVAGLEAETFLILPHPEVAGFLQRKVSDRDGWIEAMRRLQDRLTPPS